jgi:hypothetical protein
LTACDKGGNVTTHKTVDMFTVNQSAKVARCGRKASLTPSGALTVPVQPGGPLWLFERR